MQFCGPFVCPSVCPIRYVAARYARVKVSMARALLRRANVTPCSICYVDHRCKKRFLRFLFLPRFLRFLTFFIL